MPRQIADDDEMPRRRRSAKAVAIEAEEERGLVMRMLLHSPKDVIAGALAFSAAGAIIANALFLQAGRHPSPMFGTVTTMPTPVLANPLPRPRPLEAAGRAVDPLAQPEPRSAEARSADPRTTDPRTTDSKTADSKAADPMTNLVVKATGGAPAAAPNVARPPAPIPARGETTQSTGSRRVAAVQRALTEYGYGQLKPTGTVGADTQAAIQKFERDRKIPVTGQMSERLVKELAAVIGHPVE